MNKVAPWLIVTAGLGIIFSGRAAGQNSEVQNKESMEMQEMLRPYLDLSYEPPDGLDKNRPSIKENALKIADALPSQLSAPPSGKRRILVLTYKTMGQLHVPGAAGLLTLLRDAEKKYGAFEFTELYTSQGVDSKMLSGYDAVVLNNISQTWGPEEETLYNRLLPEYVKNGGGLFADHGVALIYMDRPDAEFNNMIGGGAWHNNYLQSGVHPKTVNNWSHVSPFFIKLPEPENPLAAAFRCEPMSFTYKSCQLNGNRRVEWPVTFNAPNELADELYAMNPTLNKNHTARCIVSLDPDKVPKESFPADSNDNCYSLIWINSYGKGRVYYTELGHNQGVFSVPCVAQSMLDGLQYAAGDMKIPSP
jgi:type 1 glutamine amidotransferase